MRRLKQGLVLWLAVCSPLLAQGLPSGMPLVVLQGAPGPVGPAGPSACGQGDLAGDCTVKSSAAALTTLQNAMPQPSNAIPPGATPIGSAGAMATFLRSDATSPSLTRSVRTTTSGTGTFTVTWTNPLVSAVPTAFAFPPDNTTSNTACKVQTATQNGVSGLCTVTATQLVSLIGLTVSLASTPAANMMISVFSREPAT